MKIIRTKEGLALLIPESVARVLGVRVGDEMEIKHIDGKVFAIYPRAEVSSSGIPRQAGTGKKQPETEQGTLRPEEMSILRKLNRIRFPDRTVNAIKREFTSDELRILEDLVRKGVVLKMVEGKYKSKGGVYSISKDYYPLVQREDRKEGETVLETMERQLARDGYLVIRDGKLAEEFADFISEDLGSGRYLGLKGFDKSYYFVSQQFLSKMGNRIRKILESGPMGVEELSGRLKTDQEAVRAVLEILRESGEVIERRKGVYVLA